MIDLPIDHMKDFIKELGITEIVCIGAYSHIKGGHTLPLVPILYKAFGSIGLALLDPIALRPVGTRKVICKVEDVEYTHISLRGYWEGTLHFQTKSIVINVYIPYKSTCHKKSIDSYFSLKDFWNIESPHKDPTPYESYMESLMNQLILRDHLSEGMGKGRNGINTYEDRVYDLIKELEDSIINICKSHPLEVLRSNYK